MADKKISALPAATLPLGASDAVPVEQGGITKKAPRSAFDGAVTSVAGRTGAVVLTKADVGLSLADNTADTAKPVSTLQAAADSATLASANATTAGHVANVANPHSVTAAQVGADAAGTAAAAVVAHVALGDPHAQYALESALGTLAT